MSSDEALATDAAIYARQYGVDQQEAERRIRLMVAGQGVVQNLEEAEGDGLVSGSFEHGSSFAYVIETNAPAKERKIVKFSSLAGTPEFPVEYKQNSKIGRGKMQKLFREKNNVIDRLLPSAMVTSFDERRTILSISLPDTVDRAEAAKNERQLENSVGVEVNVSFGPLADLKLGMKGGHQLWRNSGTSTNPIWITQCSLSFAAQSPDLKQGYLSAGHCANNTAWKEPGSSTYQSLTVRDMRSPTGDWAFVYGPAVDRLIKADNSGSLRAITGRRTLATTCEKTGWSVITDRQAIVVTSDGSSSYCSGASSGTFVCWYGGHYGPGWPGAHGTHSTGHAAANQQCGEVNAKYVKMDGCGPSENLACDYSWVEVIPKAGIASFTAGPGDSGSPIFAWNTAFGIVTHASATQGYMTQVSESTGTAKVMWYTPMDDVYRQSHSLLY